MLDKLISPERIKKEPLDLDESTDQLNDNSFINVKIEDEESDHISVPTVRKRGRPKKNPTKSTVAKPKKSQPVTGGGTAVILKTGRKRKSKITSYFKRRTSKPVESPMESVPVPVEVTSIPEVVTPKGATLPIEASIAAVSEAIPTESALLSAASLKVIPSEGTSMNAIPTDATNTEYSSPPSKPTAAQDSTCVDESPPNVNSIPESIKKAISLNDACSSLAPHDSKEETPQKTSTENLLERTSVNVSPTKATPAKTPVAVAQSTSKCGSSNNTPSNRGRKRKFCPEAVQIPFQMGWMREMVNRANEGNKVGQKVSDIYYFSPEGIKLRSMVEIGNYLSKHSECTLTLDNFTFARELIYHEPLEIERSAKQKSVLSTLPKFYKTKILDRSKEMDAAMQKSPMKKFAPPLPSIPKLTIKNINQGLLKTFTCVLGESSSNSNRANDPMLNKKSQSCFKDNNAPSPKKFKASPVKQSISKKDTSKVKSNSHSLTSKKDERTSAAQSNIKKSDPAQIQRTLKQNSSGSKKANSSVIQSRAKLKSPLPKIENFPHRPCTYLCEMACYQIPNIQCALCYCLFHKSCVPKVAKSVGYACKSCISKKLALYETVKNPNAPALYTEEEEQDIPLDIEVSSLFPEIELKELSNCELKFYNSSVNINQSGYATSVNPLKTPDAFNPTPPKPVPYMPCLVRHLLRPPSPLHAGSMQNASRPYVPLLPSPQVRQSEGNSVLPKSIPAKTSASNCRPILVHCSRNGKTVVRNGLVVTAPANTNPLTALKSLTQDIQPSAEWAGVSSSLNSNFSVQSFSGKNNSDLNDVSPISQKLSAPNDSILAATLSGRIPSDGSYSRANQSTYVNRFLTGHDCFQQVFKTLDVCDLLRAGQVCKSWNYLCSQSFLWEKMKFSNLMVTNWKECCLFLKKVGTKCLDFQDIIHPSNELPFESLKDYISILNNVEEVIFDQIPSSFLISVALNLHQLRKLECHYITDALNEEEMWNSTCTFKLSCLQGLNRLTKLKLNSGGGVSLKCDPEYLMPFLPNLRYLTLTGFKFGSHINLECLSMHKELISLELGDCFDIEPEVYALLGSLKKLRCLRLENGGSLDDNGFVDCLKKMTSLEILELMNFKIPKNLEKAFQHFQQLIHLNIWPDTTSEGSIVNNNLLQALTQCKDLSYACWGVITEGEDDPDKLEIKNHENETEELSYEELFHKLVKMLPECRVEVKFVPRKSWREFCSVRD